MVISTVQLHSIKPELRFYAGSNPARGMSEIRDGEDLWQWSRLEIRLNAFRRSNIPQKQFIIIIIITIIIIKLYLQGITIQPCMEYCHDLASTANCYLDVLYKIKEPIWEIIAPMLATCLELFPMVKV